MLGNNSMDEIEPEPSELGTKEYWDETYSAEIKNFHEFGDVGEVWFGEDSGLRIMRWMCSTDLISKDDSIIDIGCGNGMMTIELAREGFSNLTGIDYSENAINLAQCVADAQHLTVKYKLCDMLETGSIWHPKDYAVALDKGTYDAISLHPEDAKEKRQRYVENVSNLLRPRGLLIITSCNWTEQELMCHFNNKFCLLHVIPTPSFHFGGKTGNVVTSLVLQKKN